MTDPLDNIFRNIYLSEQESKAQHEYLANLKTKLATSEREVREIEEKCKTLSERTAMKVNRLSSREITLRMLKLREELLQERICELKVEKENLIKEETELRVKLATMRQEFCCEAKKFQSEFGFHNKFSKKNFPHMSLYNIGDMMDKQEKKVPSSMSVNKPCIEEDLKVQKSVQDIEEMKALLFDVDFGSSPTN